MTPYISFNYSRGGYLQCTTLQYNNVVIDENPSDIIYNCDSTNCVYDLSTIINAILVYNNFNDVNVNCHYCHNEMDLFNEALCHISNNSCFICKNCIKIDEIDWSDISGYYNVPCLNCKLKHHNPLYRYISYNQFQNVYTIKSFCSSCQHTKN